MKGTYSPEYFQITIERRELDTLIWVYQSAVSELALRPEEAALLDDLEAIRAKKDG